MADHGVLIVGSGSLTHTVCDFRGQHLADLAYVDEFSGWVREAVAAGDGARMHRTLDDAPQAARAHPTPEHFWPLLVAAGAAPAAQPWRVIAGGIAHGTLAMDAVVFGHA